MEITNETPWDTKALAKFLHPYLDRLQARGWQGIEILNHKPMPGVARAKQSLVIVKPSRNNRDEHVLVICLLTPKRARSRVDPLDRLAFVGSLKAHETALSAGVLGRVDHAMKNLMSRQRTTYNALAAACERGICECSPTFADPPLIRGDTRAKTQEPVALKRLQQQHRWAVASIQKAEDLIEKATKKRDKLQARIAKHPDTTKARG